MGNGRKLHGYRCAGYIHTITHPETNKNSNAYANNIIDPAPHFDADAQTDKMANAYENTNAYSSKPDAIQNTIANHYQMADSDEGYTKSHDYTLADCDEKHPLSKSALRHLAAMTVRYDTSSRQDA